MPNKFPPSPHKSRERAKVEELDDFSPTLTTPVVS